MNSDDIARRVFGRLNDLGIKDAHLKSSFMDFGWDSIDEVEFVIWAEDEFGIDIYDDECELSSQMTMEGFYSFILGKIRECHE